MCSSPVSSNSGALPDRPAPKVSIRDCLVRRDGRDVLFIDALDIPRGQVTALIGPNGAGKSTLLALLQLLLPPLRGDLRLDGVPMRDDVLATRRRMAAAFQDPLLLSTTVRKNLETALRLHKVPRAHRRERALRWLTRFGVDHLADRHARDLSGGEAQRVSLARAFALEPELLLLDEPFSALDAPTRAALIDDFAAIVRDTGVTTVLVTHDRDEALRLADRVVVMFAGRLRQVGPPADLFAAPVDEEVAAFVGVENVWPAILVRAVGGLATYRVGDNLLDVVAQSATDRALFCIRPEEVTLFPPNDTALGSARNHLAATVQTLTPAGPVVRVRLAVDGQASPLVAAVTHPSLEALALRPGSRALASFKATAAHLIPQPSPTRLS